MTDPEDAELKRLLETDALAEAERMTGKSYKEDSESMGLGMSLQMSLSAAKRAALKDAGDTYMTMPLDDALHLFYLMGFDEVLQDNFTAFDRHDQVETYRVLWRNDGILATVESYRGDQLNMSKIYYNVEFPPGTTRIGSVTSSGKLWSDDWNSPEGRRVWVGDHDAREGVRYSMRRLDEAGTFLPVWVERPFLWLVNFAESKVPGYNHSDITEERVARLPEHVRDAITP